jgi:tRNA A37 threonylcarbamoyltransferase TsaD
VSNNLPVITSGIFPSKLDRQVSKALSRLDANQLVALREDQLQVDRVATTAERGMARAAQIGAFEATLVSVAPNAAAYVHASAVAGAIGIAGVVHDAARGL